MPSRTTTILLAATAVATIAVLANKKPPAGPPVPTPDPIPGVQGGGGPAVAALALTSIPLAGPTHNGLLRTDNTWTIATSMGSLVAQGVGEASFLDRWLFYTRDGVRGVLLQGAVEVGGFTVRPPPCAPGAPGKWCYTTTQQPALVRRSSNRAAALTAALARARAGA
jgi:hypothetical protein